MSYKKFESKDIIFNTIKTNPRFEFTVVNGEASINNGNPNIEIGGNINTPAFNYYSLDFHLIQNSFYLGYI